MKKIKKCEAKYTLIMRFRENEIKLQTELATFKSEKIFLFLFIYNEGNWRKCKYVNVNISAYATCI